MRSGNRQMIGVVWRELKIIVMACALVLVIAYSSDVPPATLGWLLTLLLVTTGFQVVKTLRANRMYVERVVVDHSSADLRREMNMLVQQVEISVKNMLGHVRKELGQMRSLVSDAIGTLQDSFYGLNQESLAQNAMVLNVLEKLDGIHEVVRDNIKDVTHSTQRIDQMTADAVRSLQFEDIVRQLTESSEVHLDYLESVLGVVDAGMHSLNSQELTVSEYIKGLHKLKLQIDRIETERMAAAEKSVSQVSMSDGGVVLF